MFCARCNLFMSTLKMYFLLIALMWKWHIFRYQAIECFLANVQPVHPVEGTQWNHEAINKFEELTHGMSPLKTKTFRFVYWLQKLFLHWVIIISTNYVVSVAKWKKLIAKTVKIRERFRGYDASLRESSTIPGIDLYDIIDGNALFLPIHTFLSELVQSLNITIDYFFSSFQTMKWI